MILVIIPVKNLQVMRSSKKLNTELLNIKLILHFICTLVFLLYTVWVFVTTTPFIMIQFTICFSLSMLYVFLFIRYCGYYYSASIFKLFRCIKTAYQLIGLVYLLHSFIQIEVMREISKIFDNTVGSIIENELSIWLFAIEFLIIVFTAFLAQVNGNLFKEVVSAKKRKDQPGLIISWKKKAGKRQDDKPPKYEELKKKNNDKDAKKLPFGEAVV